MEVNQLHIAAEKGDAELFKSILCQEEKIIIGRNKDGNNPLDIAIQNKNCKIAEFIAHHERCWEFLHNGRSDRGLTQLQTMLLDMPRIAEKFLDRCVEQKTSSESNSDTQIKYDFQLFFGRSADLIESLQTASNTLKIMVKEKEESCMTHPVCVAYLKDFWVRIGFWMFLINFIFYLVFLSCLTSLAILLEHRSKELIPLIRSLRILVIILSGLQSLRELMLMNIQRYQYFKNFESWFQLALYTTSIVSVIHYGKFEATLQTSKALRGFMALSVFLAFSNILLYMRSSFVFGTYIVIMFTIIKTLLRIVILLVPFVCAYGIPYYIIFSIPENDPSSGRAANKSSGEENEENHQLFDTIPLSIWTTFMLLLGEMKYPHTLYKYQPIPFPEITYCIYITMVLCMPIIVKNLLIGLSVGDIKRIVDDSRRSHLFSQVENLIEIEARLPAWIRRKIFVNHVIVYPFREDSFKVKVLSTGFPTMTTIEEKPAQEEKEMKLEDRITSLAATIHQQDSKISEILSILKDMKTSKTIDSEDLSISIA